MTAPDHTTKPLENILRERGHPYIESYSARFGRRRRGHAPSATASSYVATARLFLMGRLVVCRVRNFPNVGRFCSPRIAVGVAFRDFAPRHNLSALARRRERRRPCLVAADRVANRALDDDKSYHRGSSFPLQIASITTCAATTLREFTRAFNDLRPRPLSTRNAFETRRVALSSDALARGLDRFLAPIDQLCTVLRYLSSNREHLNGGG